MTIDRRKLIESVDRGKSLDFLSRMVRFKSYSNTPGERELATFMVEAMRGIGLDAELQPVEGERSNAIGRWPGVGRGKSLLFNGHMDTNPATEGWTVDPWGGKVDDKFIYGIGVSNMKAGDAAYFCAVKTLIDNGVRLKGDVILTFVVGELQGGIGTVRMIEQGVRADHFINSEPTDLAALTLHAGAFNYVIELTGVTRHISKREEAVDAIAIASEIVPRINALTFSGATTPDHRSVNRANVGVIRGSLTPEFHDWRPPQVADYVRMSGTCRYAPSQSEESCLADLRTLLKEFERKYPGLKSNVMKAPRAQPIGMLPFEVDKNARIVRTLNAAYKTVRGVEQPTGAIPPPCFYGTDAAHLLHRARMEGVVCGPGGRYNTMPDERVDIPDYLDMIRVYMLAILDICEPS
ncbi:MAG TPA: M20/M25/M40 family metallo-hydrolase [Stellaceae bacterium]|nr:M20/M25/M40 family metallo-hydrolase [Stellaceae bacterium]